MWREKPVRVLDAWCDRSKPENGEHVGYRGVGEVGVTRLAQLYYEITSAANGGADDGLASSRCLVLREKMHAQ